MKCSPPVRLSHLVQERDKDGQGGDRGDLTSAEDDRLGPNRVALERRAEAPAKELSADVGRDLDAGAHFSKDVGGLEDGGMVAGLGEGKRGGKAA